MIKNKAKWITIAFMLIVLLIFSGFNVFKKEIKVIEQPVTNISELKGKSLGGVVSRMPASSTKILFESLMGVKLGGYTAYDGVEETLGALKTGSIQAAWFCDVTADYLLRSDNWLRKLDTLGAADIENTRENRFEFGLATVNDESGKKLNDDLNIALETVSANGALQAIIEKYINYDIQPEFFYEEDMLVNINDFYRKLDAKPLYIGISGAVPPLELLDKNKPCNFCVALMDEIGQVLERRIKFVVLGSDTIFTSLMSGRIDAVFCYGSNQVTTEGTKPYLVTKGYYPMKRYEFLSMGGLK